MSATEQQAADHFAIVDLTQAGETTPARFLASIIGSILFALVLAYAAYKFYTHAPADGASYLGLTPGAVVMFAEPKEAPFTLILSRDWAKGTTLGTHRVTDVDQQKQVLRLRTLDGSKIVTRIPFAWIAAVSEINPLLDIDQYGDDKEAK